MKPYLSIPVETAREISRRFDKQIVIICAWNNEHQLMHTVTYGAQPDDKLKAARGGELVTAALGMDISKKRPTEDFRTLGAARNAQLRDMADRIVHVLRSYQFGNSAPDPAKDLADEIEALLKSEAEAMKNEQQN